jgi:predicted outer membrane repeat protein
MNFYDCSLTFIENKSDMVTATVRAATHNILGLGGATSMKEITIKMGFYNGTSVTFQGNIGRHGGAIYNAGQLRIKCLSCNFDGNIATSNGGAIYVGLNGGTGGILELDSSRGNIVFQNNGSQLGVQAGHDIYLARGNIYIDGTANSVVISSDNSR